MFLFETREDVITAFLFGSQAKGYARAASDWDIAVYIRKENREREHAIWKDIEDIVGREVDLVVLNRAGIPRYFSAFRVAFRRRSFAPHAYGAVS